MTWQEKLNAELNTKQNCLNAKQDHFNWTYKKLLGLIDSKDMLSLSTFTGRLLQLAEDLKETQDEIDNYKINIGQLKFIRGDEQGSFDPAVIDEMYKE